MRRTSAISVIRLTLGCLVLGAPLWLGAAPPLDAGRGRVAGTYSDKQLAGIKSLTLPRMFLYDGRGALIAREHWPSELQEIKKHAGDAFCCVSDKPAPPGSSGPPPDCKVVVYGTDVRANFEGLVSPSGKSISYEALPKHKYLLVDYYATWCQPCVSGRKVLERFFSSSPQARDYVWVSIDMSRLPEVQEAARARKR